MPIGYQDRYNALLEMDKNIFKTDKIITEQFIRQVLSLLEADLRVFALLSLQEWASTEITSKDLFHVIGRLQRPAWGEWNTLLIQLRKLQRKTLETADKATRDNIRNTHLSLLFARLDENIKTKDNVQWLRPLFKVFNPKGGKLPRNVSLQTLLAAPIALRNRIAHHAPTADDFSPVSATLLYALIHWLNHRTDLSAFLEKSEHQSPWFIKHKEQWLSYSSLNKGTVNYLSNQSICHQNTEQLKPLLLMFYRLMGKTAHKEQQLTLLLATFNKEFGKLAPEKLQGVFIDDFLVGKKIGEGGHATVHKGIQLSTGRTVAIKMLKDGMDDEMKQRFQQEATILSRFNRADIVSVVDHGSGVWQCPKNINLEELDWYQTYFKNASAQKTYMALEWIEGNTLADYFQSDKTPNHTQLTHWFIKVAEALARVHEDGYIHRDIKPSNIMIRVDGQLKLMDFGIALSTQEERTRFTSKGIQLGTPIYMSPEQIVLGETTANVGFSADIYGLTATFYELYTQQRLYLDETGKYPPEQTIIRKKQDGDSPVAAKKIIKEITWELDTILSAGLKNEPTDRYKSMAALKQDLQHYLQDEPIAYQQPSIKRRMQLGYRRNREALNIAAGALVIIGGLTGGYIYTVTFERDRANNERTSAIALINYMNIDLRDKLQPIGKLSIMDDVQQRINEYFGSIVLGENDLNTLREQAVGIQQYANTLQQQGKAQQASILLLQAHESFKRLVKQQPYNEQWQNDLSISFSERGNVYENKGLNDKALNAYQQSHAIFKKLSRNDPRNKQWQRDLSVSLHRLGGIYLKKGQHNKALKIYQDAFAITQKLTDNNPHYVQWQWDLSISFERLAEIYQQNGQNKKAFKAYQSALAIRQKLVKKNPEHAQLERDLSISYEKISEIYLQNGENDKGLKAYQSSFLIVKKLAENDPDNVDWQRFLSISYTGLADLYQQKGQDKKAFKAYQQALNIAKKQADNNPSDIDWQRDLSISYETMGDIYLQTGQNEEAVKAYQDSLLITKKLADIDKNNVIAQRDLSVIFGKLGDIYLQNGQSNKALEKYQDSLAITKQLITKDPDHTKWQQDLSVSLIKLGDIHRQNRRYNEAVEVYKQSLLISKTLVKSDPKHIEWQQGLAISYEKLADLYQEYEQNNKALQAYQNSSVIFKQLAVSDPDYVEWQRSLSVSLMKQGDFYLKNKQNNKAVKMYQGAHTLIEKLATSNANNIMWRRDLAVSFSKLGDISVKKEQTKNAIKWYQKALTLTEDLARNDHATLQYSLDIAEYYYKLSPLTPQKTQLYFQKAEYILHTLKQAGKLSKAEQRYFEHIKKSLL
jgi:serine/threonine protein kinase